MKNTISYRNGNYWVTLDTETGTKMRYTSADYFDAQFPENIDIKITNWCNKNCPMCHEGSSTSGCHADLLNIPFIKTLTAGTELAIGGGMVTSHPYLIPFLHQVKEQGVIANITVHQLEFKENKKLIEQLISEKLVNGLGISVSYYDKEVIEYALAHSNVVLHLIVGLARPQLLDKLASKENLKILLLGYKQFRRGVDYFNEMPSDIIHNTKYLKENLNKLYFSFKVVSFDNLAIEQLDVYNNLSKSSWNQFYMGNDSQHTMYIDLVERKFAANSTTPMENRYDLLDTISEMFNTIKNSCKN